MKKSIGAFWKQMSKSGKAYYSGNIEIAGKKIQLVAFDNANKQGKQPDIQVYLSEPKAEKTETQENGIPF